jgi:hypothetical protein
MQDTTQATTPAEIKRYQCRHIFTDGHRCGSPCLRHEEFCYYHHTTRRPIENPRERRNRQAQFDLPLPEDRAAIQLSIGEVLRRIANNEIDSKRAGLLLYGLQIASLNLPRATAPSTTAPVEEIIADPQLGTLAPKAEVTQQEERKGYVGTLLELLKYDPEEKREPEPQFDPAELAITPLALTPLDEPTILPEIQAHEDAPPSHQTAAPQITRCDKTTPLCIGWCWSITYASTRLSKDNKHPACCHRPSRRTGTGRGTSHAIAHQSANEPRLALPSQQGRGSGGARL